MQEEEEVLTHGINQIWDAIIRDANIEFASKEINASWVVKRT